MKNKLSNILSNYKFFTDAALPVLCLSSSALFIPLTGLMFNNGQAEISAMNWSLLLVVFSIGNLYAFLVLKYSPFQKAKEDK